MLNRLVLKLKQKHSISHSYTSLDFDFLTINFENVNAKLKILFWEKEFNVYIITAFTPPQLLRHQLKSYFCNEQKKIEKM